jgi:hypothetical protein
MGKVETKTGYIKQLAYTAQVSDHTAANMFSGLTSSTLLFILPQESPAI